MAIIETIKSGNCTIYIDDTYCKDKTKEDNKQILERIGDLYYKAWLTGKLKDSPNKK